MVRFLEYLQNSKRGTVWFFAAFFILAAALYLPLILISDNWPSLDVASRYAPMAEAFSRGDFQYAFHPRCQMLHTSVAGVIASVLGCDGFLACKLSSLLFFALSAIPLYSICRRIWGKKTAYGAVLLFAFCFPVITETAITGLRDPAKMLVQLLLVCGIVQIYQERKNLKGYICAGAAAGLAVCTREDLALPAVTVLLAAGIFERKESSLILRSVAGVLTALVIS
ncbi:MAG: glycosyltransferase family 39 protein, partial [Lentisphaeria bacterium]|nr:glycosyltransferase family 39 protein [Lentisphaeria bacterium]